MLEYLNDNYECGRTTVKAAGKPHDLRLKAWTMWSYSAEHQNFAICVHSVTVSQATALSKLFERHGAERLADPEDGDLAGAMPQYVRNRQKL